MVLYRKPRSTDAEATKIASEAANLAGYFGFYTGGKKTNTVAVAGRTPALLAGLGGAYKGKVVPLADAYPRAASASDKGVGYDAEYFKSSLGKASGAKPAIFFLLVRDDAGNYRASYPIPFPDAGFSSKPFRRGDIVIPAPKAEAPKLPAAKK